MEMTSKLGISYKCISTGKLRRYFSFQNFVDFFRVPFGVFQAISILKRFKPQVLFSKGGYVSFPVMFAAYLTRTPSILHESDVSPGLANKLSAKMAKVLCLAHYESQQYFPRETKKIVTGNPVRDLIFHGDPENAYKLTHFSKNIPTILVMGGSQGASRINEEISLAANELVRHYQIIHICGKGKIPEAIPLPDEFQNRYKAFEYVDKLLADLYSISDLVITRAGANSLAEIDALQIPAVLIPLGKAASRGDQVINALVFQEGHPETRVIEDETLNYHHLIKIIKDILPFESFEKKERTMIFKHEPTKKIIDVLDSFLGETCIKEEEE